MTQITLPRTSFIEIIQIGFKNFANFDDRMRRSEYWLFALFFFIFELILMILLALTSKKREDSNGKIYYSFSPAVEIIFLMYELFIILPRISSTFRRLHDIGKSGLYFLIGFAPLVGPIILFYYLCLDSQREENKYGPSPKYFHGEEIDAPLSQNEEQKNNIHSSNENDNNNIEPNNNDKEEKQGNDQYNPINQDDNLEQQENQ